MRPARPADAEAIAAVSLRAAGFEPDGREREWVADGGGAATIERSFRS